MPSSPTSSPIARSEFSQKLPVIILGGADAKPGPHTNDVDSHQVLTGVKGLIQLPNGRCLAEELVTRFTASGCFEEPIVVGPAEMYRGRVSCRVVDVRGNLLATLQRIRQLIYEEFEADAAIAFCTCDVLPSAAELKTIIEDCYLPNKQSVFWTQLVRAEADAMTASSWKPRYLFRTDPDSKPEYFYPGHLLVLKPAALRLRLLSHLLSLAYRQRNRPLWLRALLIPVFGFGRLLLEDIRGIPQGKVPWLSFLIPYTCFAALLNYWRRRLSVADFSLYLQKLFVHRDYQKEHKHAALVSTTDILSFAKDIDTVAELNEQLQSLSPRVSKQRPELSVLSLNLAHGRKDNAHQLFLGTKQIRSNLDDIIRVFQREKPLLISLQEADATSAWNGGFNHVQYLANGAEYPYHYLGAHMRRLNLNYGTALLSRLPLEKARSCSFRSSWPLPPKGFVVASVDWPGIGAVDIVSLHLDFLRARIRLAQVESIIQTLQARGRPRVIMGDFNCAWNSKDSALRRIAHELELNVFEPEATHLGTFPARDTRWDWILASDCFVPQHYDVLTDTLSDHRAVLARFTLG